jgi:hypothetical protein
MDALLHPGEPIDLDLLSRVASSVGDLSLSPSIREAANEILCEFAKRPDIDLYCDEVLTSRAPDIAKYAVLFSLESNVRNCWKLFDSDRKNSIRSCLIGCIWSPSISVELLPKINEVLLHIVRSEYPEEWPTFLGDLVAHCQSSKENCVRWFRLLVDFIIDGGFLGHQGGWCDHEMMVVPGAVSKAVEDITAYGNELSDLMMRILRDPPEPSFVRLVTAGLSRLIRFVTGPQFFESPLFGDICALLGERPDLALETIPVITEAFTFLYIPRENQASVRALFVLLMQALDPLFGPDLSGARNIASRDFFTGSIMCGFCCLVTHYFNVIFDAEIAPTFFRMLDMVLALTDSTDEEAFENHFARFWNALGEQEELMENEAFVRLFPALLDRFLRKMPSPFSRFTRPGPNGEQEDHITEQGLPTGSYLLRRMASHDRSGALLIVEGVLEACVAEQNFEGVCHVCYALGAFVEHTLTPENCELAATLVRTVLGVCASIETFENRATVAIGIGAFFADISSVLVGSFPLLRVVVHQLLDFLVAGDTLLQEATLLSLVRILRYAATHREVLTQEALGQLFDDIFERVPRMLESFSDLTVREFFTKMQIPSFNTFTLRTEKLLTLAGNRIDELAAQLPSDVPALFDQLGNYFVVLAASNSLNWRQTTSFFDVSLPRYFELYRFLVGLLQECTPDTDLFNSLRDAKHLLAGLFSKAIRTPLDQHFTQEFFTFFMDDFANSDPEIRSPTSLTLFTAGLRIEAIWSQQAMIGALFEKVISPTEAMIRSEFDQYSEFYLPLSELLIELLVKELKVLREDEIHYIFETLIGQVSVACEARSLLMSRLSAVFIAVEIAHGTDVAAPLLAAFAVPLVETIFHVILKAGKGTDVYGLAAAMHTILAHPYMKKNMESVCELIFRIAPGCRPEVAHALIAQAFDGPNLAALLDTMRSLMLEMRTITPGESIEMFSQAKVAQVMAKIEEFNSESKEEESVKEAEAGEFGGVTERLRGFSVERR